MGRWGGGVFNHLMKNQDKLNNVRSEYSVEKDLVILTRIGYSTDRLCN